MGPSTCETTARLLHTPTINPAGLTQLGRSEYVDEESRRAAMEGAKAIDDAARHRSVMEEGVVHEKAIEDDRRRP